MIKIYIILKYPKFNDKWILTAVTTRDMMRIVVSESIKQRSLLFLPRDASAERGDATVSCPSVCPFVCPSVCNVQVPCSNRLEFFENNFTAE